MKPQLIVHQKITAFVNKYLVYAPGDMPGEVGELRAFAQQKRFNIKEKVLFYSDEAKTNLAFTFRAEKVFDVHGKYLVEDNEGVLIGYFQKDFVESLARSTWRLYDANGNELYRVTESSQAVAILRRFAGFIPLVGELIDLVMPFIRYHFSFIDVSTNQEIGKYVKTTLFRDHYQLEMDDSSFSRLDWRVMAAYSVALDMLQSR